MNSDKLSPFSYDGRSLEVRLILKDDTWRVRVFEGDTAANGAVYSASANTVADAHHYNLDLLADLAETARLDFVRWSEWIKSAQRTSSK